MMDKLSVIFTLQPHPLMERLCQTMPAEVGKTDTRLFPDGESYLKLETDVRGRHCIILADLSYPDPKFLPLSFMAETMKELGASSVGLVAPYLCYMRQDRRFHEGEAITSRIFANLVSRQFDWMVTVDPHLHRYDSLDEIYTIPSKVVQGEPKLADWLANEKDIFLVGPDAESEQWVSKIADYSGHPFVIGEKNRLGDRNVVITLPDLASYQGKTAVIIDDVISSGHTVLECMRALRDKGIENMDCACVHGIFSGGIEATLREKGLRRLVTCNTIPHDSNSLDVSDLLVPAIHDLVLGMIVK